MIKVLLVCLTLLISLNGKDFYYSFIDKDKSQISDFNKKNILSANYKLETIKRLVREGQLDDAYKNIIKFREKNKIKLLNSKAILLYSEILHKRGSNKLAREAILLLEDSINNSKIHREELLDAYRLLVELNIKVNKPDDAKYYASSIGTTFDNPLSKALGKISLAQIDIHKRRYKKAINILYKILVETRDIRIATVVADELFDVYVLDGQDEKAYNLVGKVLQKNIEYYANDSFLAIKKVDKLINANIPSFAIDILKMLLDKAVEPKSIDKFKFRLANTYMRIAGQNEKHMMSAKELYKDLMARKKKIGYYKQVKIALDEILMREGKLEPSQVAARYSNSESMEQKVMLQELLNDAKQQKYASIQKMKKIYSKISDTTSKRFGYKNIAQIFDIINSDMIKFYLKNDKCIELAEVLYLVRDEAIEELVKDKNSSIQLFNCLTEVPDERSYQIAKSALDKSRNAQIYFSLEKIALLLDNVDDAYEYVQKIDMVNDDKVREKEFLYRFQVYGKLNSATSIKQFFRYTSKYPEYIEKNKDNPLIIDFYYQYYLYMKKENNIEKSLEILNELYTTQNEMKAYVYSPFVELELSKNAKLNDDYNSSIKFLDGAIKNTRKITDNELANIYYDMAKIYEKLNQKERYKLSVQKCKDIKGADNLYKTMCDKL